MCGEPNQSPQPQVGICTDGGCEPKPGPGVYGVVLLHPKKHAEASGGFRLTTDNRMEMLAAVAGPEMLKQLCKVKTRQPTLSPRPSNPMGEGGHKGWSYGTDPFTPRG